MTLLQLLNRLRVETLASGSPLATAQGLSGESQRLLNYVIDAHRDIESAHQDWQWMRKSASFTTVAGQSTYTVGDMSVTDFGRWIPQNFRNYTTSVGLMSEILMSAVEWEAYRDAYLYGATRFTQSRPMVISITPDKSIALGPVPAAGYTVTGEYYRSPKELSADTDTPDMPSQYQLAIVWRALVLYGGYEGAQDALMRGETEYTKLVRRMEIDRLPVMLSGAALA